MVVTYALLWDESSNNNSVVVQDPLGHVVMSGPASILFLSWLQVRVLGYLALYNCT